MDEAMIESPVLQEFVQEAVAERAHQMILRFLAGRFGSVAPEIAVAVRSTQDEAKLDELADWAARCHNLDEFRTHLNP